MDALATLISELARMLQVRDLAALDTFARVQHSLAMAEPTRTAVLRRAVEQLDFAAALTLLSDLARQLHLSVESESGGPS